MFRRRWYVRFTLIALLGVMFLIFIPSAHEKLVLNIGLQTIPKRLEDHRKQSKRNDETNQIDTYQMEIHSFKQHLSNDYIEETEEDFQQDVKSHETHLNLIGDENVPSSSTKAPVTPSSSTDTAKKTRKPYKTDEEMTTETSEKIFDTDNKSIQNPIEAKSTRSAPIIDKPTTSTILTSIESSSTPEELDEANANEDYNLLTKAPSQPILTTTTIAISYNLQKISDIAAQKNMDDNTVADNGPDKLNSNTLVRAKNKTSILKAPNNKTNGHNVTNNTITKSLNSTNDVDDEGNKDYDAVTKSRTVSSLLTPSIQPAKTFGTTVLMSRHEQLNLSSVAATVATNITKSVNTTKEDDGDKTKMDGNSTLRSDKQEPKRCKPIENVIFVKTHKTGSSTIINIMQRYSDNHNLSIALPGLPSNNHFVGWPHFFSKQKVFEYNNGSKYNFICNHARFSKQKMLDVIRDKNKTKIITILRDPLKQFESAAVYFKYASLFKLPKGGNIVDEFFKREQNDISKILKKSRSPISHLVKNPNAFDLGFQTWHEDAKNISDIVSTVQRDFDVVMISEHMIESLVLLKNELCWDLEDVVYFTMNKRPDKFRQQIQNVSETREKIKQWNKIDDTLYQTFNKTLWEKVHDENSKQFLLDVEKLRALNKELDEKCLNHTLRQYDKSQPWFPILGFRLKGNIKGTKYERLCEQMIKSEIVYDNYLRTKQSKRGWTIISQKQKLRNIIKDTKVKKI